MKKRNFILVFSIPFLIFAGIWQVFTYQQLQEQVELLEEEQRNWIERNKSLIIGIETLRSPDRIEALTRETLPVGKAEPGDTLFIDVLPGGSNGE